MSGYDGEGTGIDPYDGDGPGSGWGATVGKPGEDRMADAGSKTGFQRSDQQLADAGVAINGFNPVNAGQTAEQMESAQKVNDFLSWGAPVAMSALVPGSGVAMLAGKSIGKLLDGQPVQEVLAGIAPGFINTALNKATAGAYGKLQMAGGLSKAVGGQAAPNVGKEIVSGLMGTAGRSQERSVSPSTAPPAFDGGTELARQDTPAPQAQTTAAMTDFNPVGLGIDTPGWTAASKRYAQRKDQT